MTPVRSEFVPDPDLDREEMVALQQDLAAAAEFNDRPSIETEAISDLVIVGVDQSFQDDQAISALVAMRNGEVIERTHAVSDLSIPYIPGLLAFREGGPILKAFETLSVEPDLALFDGNGRLHFRQAGLATHIGVTLDLPSIGIAKSLLCGTPVADIDALETGDAVAITADDKVDAAEDTILGFALQTRQYNADLSINPLYVSAGHRVSPESATEIVEACCTEYKLPEPIRLADSHADELKSDR